MESKCPICLEELCEKIRAKPDACDHIFCFSCLQKWSKLGVYCPVDRKRYKKILNLDSGDAIPVKSRKRKKGERAVYDVTVVCDKCTNGDSPDILILCDCCDLGFHLYCLSPPLEKVPAGLWFCPSCVAVEKRLKEKKGITKEVEAALGFEKKISAVTTYNSDVERENSGKRVVSKVSRISESFLNNIIEEFHDITVNGNCSKDVPTSSALNDSFNKIDRLDKTFSFEKNHSSPKQSVNLKTYLRCRNQKRKRLIKNQRLEIVNNIEPKISDDDGICLKDATSKDIDLEHCLLENVDCGFMKLDKYFEDNLFSETEGQTYVEEYSQQNKGYSATPCWTLEHCNNIEYYTIKEKIPESTLLSKTGCKREIEGSTISEDSLQETYPTAVKSSLEDEGQRSLDTQGQTYVKKYDQKNKCNSTISCLTSEHSNDPENAIKGKIPESTLPSKTNHEIEIGSTVSKDSLQEIYPTAGKSSLGDEGQRSLKTEATEDCKDEIVFSPCQESPKGTYKNLNFLNQRFQQMIKEKNMFSVFDKISDADASQKKYNDIYSFVDKVSSSKLHGKYCLSCKDIIFVKSQQYCKICKLKYFKNTVNSKKYSKCTKDFRESPNANAYVGTRSSMVDKQRSVKKCGTDVSERRRHSLLCKLKKIRNSKLNFIVSELT